MNGKLKMCTFFQSRKETMVDSISVEQIWRNTRKKSRQLAADTCDDDAQLGLKSPVSDLMIKAVRASLSDDHKP
jgi:hypothetical protein